jgi:hypothetical protein
MTDVAITIRRGERLYGPYSVEQVQEMLKAGSIINEDEARCGAEESWTTLLRILALSPEASNHTEDSVLVNLDDLLGVQPANDPGSAVKKADPMKRDRTASILSGVGLIAIAFGTIDVALNMRSTTKSPPIEGSSKASNTGNSIDTADPRARELRKQTSP